MKGAFNSDKRQGGMMGQKEVYEGCLKEVKEIDKQARPQIRGMALKKAIQKAMDALTGGEVKVKVKTVSETEASGWDEDKKMVLIGTKGLDYTDEGSLISLVARAFSVYQNKKAMPAPAMKNPKKKVGKKATGKRVTKKAPASKKPRKKVDKAIQKK